MELVSIFLVYVHTVCMLKVCSVVVLLSITCYAIAVNLALVFMSPSRCFIISCRPTISVW